MKKIFRSDYNPKPDFEKCNGLIPAIVQDSSTGKVLMLAYMNPEALRKTEESGMATFYSRSRKQLWQKGETSGNYMSVESIVTDCDGDTFLLRVVPNGPACHKGTESCFPETDKGTGDFTGQLAKLIQKRKEEMPEGSYTTRLFREGTGKIAQKVGEESVELIIEAMRGDRERFTEEYADLFYHLLVLMTQMECSPDEVVSVLRKRHFKKGE